MAHLITALYSNTNVPQHDYNVNGEKRFQCSSVLLSEGDFVIVYYAIFLFKAYFIKYTQRRKIEKCVMGYGNELG
jgi:hypothetical protein